MGYGSSSPYPYSDAFSYQLSQALVWAGTADSVVNLHPNGYSSSQALATNGTRQGGWATDALTLNRHAMMWSGTAASAVDLHAAGYTDTRITAMTATQQVGDGWALRAPRARFVMRSFGPVLRAAQLTSTNTCRPATSTRWPRGLTRLATSWAAPTTHRPSV